MFEIEREGAGRVVLRGRLDVSQEARAREALDQLASSCVLDLEELSYISSGGLGLLVALQLRLAKRGEGVTLAGANPYIRELLRLAGLERVFPLV